MYLTQEVYQQFLGIFWLIHLYALQIDSRLMISTQESSSHKKTRKKVMARSSSQLILLIVVKHYGSLSFDDWYISDWIHLVEFK